MSHKERDKLFQDVFDLYNLDQKEQKEKAAGKSNNSKNAEESFEQTDKPNYPNYSYNFDLSGEQRSIINQQMRQHIQLLTQMSLLTSKDMQWDELHKDCRHMLNEVYSRSSGYSVYNQDNLYPSLNMLDAWDKNPALPSAFKDTKLKNNRKVPKLDLNPEMIKFMGESQAFPYPEMLPISALKETREKALENDKPYFAKAEDNLIALGEKKKLYRNHAIGKVSRSPDFYCN